MNCLWFEQHGDTVVANIILVIVLDFVDRLEKKWSIKSWWQCKTYFITNSLDSDFA